MSIKRALPDALKRYSDGGSCFHLSCREIYTISLDANYIAQPPVIKRHCSMETI